MEDTWTPEMRDKVDRFRHAALARGIPSADVERWLGLARTCAVVSPEVEGPVVGRLGGPIMLPPDVPVPLQDFGAYGTCPDHLIATLDLAALPADATNLALPPEGQLLLFAFPDTEVSDDSTCTGGHAVYIPAGTPVEEREVEYHGDHYLTGVAPRVDGDLHGELHLKRGLSLPEYTIYNGDAITVEHPRATELRDVWVWEAQAPSLVLRANQTWLRIGGYPFGDLGFGDPVARCAYGSKAEERLGLRPESSESPRPEDWVLLAEWHPHLEDVESAVVYWAITRRDLAAQRFDRVRVTMYVP
jgi:hypothetical protein